MSYWLVCVIAPLLLDDSEIISFESREITGDLPCGFNLTENNTLQVNTVNTLGSRFGKWDTEKKVCFKGGAGLCAALVIADISVVCE